MVVWHRSVLPNPDVDAFAQRFNAMGVPLGAEFRVNTYTTGRQGEASVASDASGNFVVVWTSEFQDGGGQGPPGPISAFSAGVSAPRGLLLEPSSG